MTDLFVRPARVAVAVVLAATACTGLAGCSSKKDQPAAGSDPLTASQGTGAVADLSKAKCSADAKGNWTFSGTVKNSRDAKATYTVTASVVKTTGGTVVVSKEFVKEIEPGKSVQFSGEKVGTTKNPKELNCVTSVRAK